MESSSTWNSSSAEDSARRSNSHHHPVNVPPYQYSYAPSHAYYQPAPYWSSGSTYDGTPLSSSQVAAPTLSTYTPTARAHGVPLASVTSVVVNTPGQGSTTARKRTGSSTTAQPPVSKRACTAHNAPAPGPSYSTQAVPGVGPIDTTAAAGDPPISSASLLSQGGDTFSERDASDVWFLMRPLDTGDPPEGFTNGVGWTSDEAKLRYAEPLPSHERYKSARVGCRLCLQQWHTWKNVHGATSAIRKHLKKFHHATYLATVRSMKLKGWDNSNNAQPADLDPTTPSVQTPFSLDEFNRRLVRWVVVDDQSINVVDCREFRDLIVYVSEHLDDLDVPHRTKLTELIKQQCTADFSLVIEEMKTSLGRISFTSDLWSNLKLLGFMAITGHYSLKDTNGNLVVRSRLVAFRSVPTSHTGVNLAAVFYDVLKGYGLLPRIGQITLDNASNNDTMMRELERLLRLENIPFDENGNRVRCFPHVINVSVKAGLSQLTKVQASTRKRSTPEDDSDYDSDNANVTSRSDPAAAVRDAASNPALIADPAYYTALLNDPVTRCRTLVTACRASGERRMDLRTAIKVWLELKTATPSRAKELLRDVDTRWSALFLMLDRMIELYGGVEAFLNNTKQDKIRKHALQAIELAVLGDIREFLYVFHTAQEVLSYEKTPTLSIAIPTYEALLTSLVGLRDNKLPRLAHAINASIWRLKKYVRKARQTKIYSLAMVLNPLYKFTWIEKHWTSGEADDAHRWTREMMLEFQRAQRSANAPTAKAVTSLPRASSAARSQASGIARMNALMESLSSKSVGGAAPSELASSVGPQTGNLSATEEAIEDKQRVESELNRYIRDGVLTSREREDFDICRWWQSKQFDYPLLYSAALDVLPVQASAVPCERVFSSSKETDTQRRTNMSPELMERLQVLKYLYSHERGESLDFSQGWLATEAELLHPTLSADLVEVLVAEGRIDELNALVLDLET